MINKDCDGCHIYVARLENDDVTCFNYNIKEHECPCCTCIVKMMCKNIIMTCDDRWLWADIIFAGYHNKSRRDPSGK